MIENCGYCGYTWDSDKIKYKPYCPNCNREENWNDLSLIKRLYRGLMR